jgi:hypothetical protein
MLEKMEYWNNGIKKEENQPIRLPGLKPRIYSGLILSGAFYLNPKIGIWRRRTYQFHCSGTHFQPIIPVFQPSNIPEFVEYH